MFIKKFLKPKKDSSTTVIRNFGFANTTSSSGQGGIVDLSNIDSKNINTINLSANNAEINNLTNQNLTNTNSAIFEGELIGRGTVDLEDANVKLGNNNTFDELTGSDASKLYANDITCDYLTVNKKAHFFELVIDKIKTVGGTVIFTPADGFTVDKVTETEDNYILFWRACTEVAEGEIGDPISVTEQIMTEPVSVNMWQEWDQALCQSFNLGDESDYYFNVSNRYWWRVVEAASDEPEIQEINGVKYYCHWIMVYKNGTSSTTGQPLVDTGSDIPQVGDAVAMLGYRYDELASPTQDDINRSSAIIIAAYDTPDREIKAPSYAQYQGIKDFSLSTYRKTFFDATRGKIFGEFVVDAGGGNTVDLDDYIKSFNNANPLEGFISTNNNQTVDLVVLQTDNNNKIYDLNNFPNNLQVMVNYEGMAQMNIGDYDALTLTLFGVTYDLLDANNYTPNLPSGYQGIYVSNITKSTYQPFRLTLAFAGSEQIVTSSSMLLYTEISNSGTTYQLNKNIPINGVSSVEGLDAEFYGLNTILESAQVDGNQTLQPELIYNLKYISGTTVTYPVPSTQSLRVTTYFNNGTSSTVPVQWDNANNYWRFYPNATTNYYSSGNPVPIYYKVELVDNNVVVDGKVVDVQLSPMATFSVGETLTTLIYAETTRVENESNNKYMLLRADVNGLTTNVSDIVNDLTGVHGSISRIEQDANSISLHVDEIDNGLQTTGIDIETGKITLAAENTDIQGNLNIHNADEGLIIYDTNTDTPKISITGDTMGTLSNNPVLNVNGEVHEFTVLPNTNTITFGPLNLGTFENGNKLSMNISVYTNSEPQTQLAAATYTFTIIKNNTTIDTITGNATIQNRDVEHGIPTTRYRISFNNYTFQELGDYQCSLTLSASSFSNEYWNMWGNYTRTINSIIKISKDACLFAPSSKTKTWIGNDQIYLEHIDNNNKKTSLQFSNGIYYKPRDVSNAGEIGSMMNVVKKNTGSSTNIGLDVGMIILKQGISNNYTVFLEAPANAEGKWHFIKNKTNNTVYVSCTGSSDSNPLIMNDDSHSLSRRMSIGDSSTLFFCDGENWIMMELDY